MLIITRMLYLLSLISIALSECELPSMSIGNFNVTSERQLKEIIKKEQVFLLGITSLTSCPECCESEKLYKSLMETIDEYTPKIPFIRLDIEKNPYIAKYIHENDIVHQIYGVKKGEFFKYLDLPDVMKILKFADNLLSPVRYIKTIEEAEEFLELPKGGFDSLRVLAILYDDDFLEDYKASVSRYANWFSADFRAVTDKEIIKSLKNTKEEVKYLNSIILLRTDDYKILDLDLPQDIRRWIYKNSLPLVSEISPFNFHMYIDSGRPLLMMFLDPLNIYHSDYVNTFARTASKFEDIIKFVWLNGTNPEYIEKKKRLGLITEILPSIAFNSRNSVNYPFPEGKEINEANLDAFVQDYLDKKTNKYVSEYTPSNIQMPYCLTITGDEFRNVVLQPNFDSVVLLYSSHNSKESEKTALIYNEVCHKFIDIKQHLVNFYVLDAAKEKVFWTIKTNKYPAIFIAPANRKQKAYIYYNGKNEVLDIMKFIEKNADVKFKLPANQFSNNTNEEEKQDTNRKQNTKEKNQEDL